jgi:hypothetical protein
MKDLLTVMWFQRTTSHLCPKEQIQNRSMSSLEKAVDFYMLLPEEFEEKQILLEEIAKTINTDE